MTRLSETAYRLETYKLIFQVIGGALPRDFNQPGSRWVLSQYRRADKAGKVLQFKANPALCDLMNSRSGGNISVDSAWKEPSVWDTAVDAALCSKKHFSEKDYKVLCRANVPAEDFFWMFFVRNAKAVGKTPLEAVLDVEEKLKAYRFDRRQSIFRSRFEGFFEALDMMKEQSPDGSLLGYLADVWGAVPVGYQKNTEQFLLEIYLVAFSEAPKEFISFINRQKKSKGTRAFAEVVLVAGLAKMSDALDLLSAHLEVLGYAYGRSLIRGLYNKAQKCSA